LFLLIFVALLMRNLDCGEYLLFFDRTAKCVESLTPELLEVLAHRCKTFGIELVEPAISFGSIFNQVGLLEDAQVLRDGRTADGKFAGEVNYGFGAVDELSENGTTGGVAKSV